MLKIGSYVTRKKYGNDILFKIEKIIDDKVILKGVDLRLYADSDIDDLVLATISKKKERQIESIRILDKEKYFYIPGIIVHIDTEFQLTNTRANPYKIRKKAIFENCKNHQKWQKNGNFYKMYYTQL